MAEGFRCKICGFLSYGNGEACLVHGPYIGELRATEPPTDQIGGNHYQGDIQPWDAMRAWMSAAEFVGFLWGNVIKYVARWRKKGGLEDLLKARHYLDKLIEFERERLSP